MTQDLGFDYVVVIGIAKFGTSRNHIRLLLVLWYWPHPVIWTLSLFVKILWAFMIKGLLSSCRLDTDDAALLVILDTLLWS